MNYTLKNSKGMNKELVEKLNIILKNYIEAFAFPFNITILFRDSFNYGALSKETLATVSKNKTYKIILHSKIMHYIAEEKYNLVNSIIYHECLHIYDMYSIRKNPLYNFNPCSSKYRNYASFIMSIGFQFWTEFYAYAKTFEYYKEYYSYKTIYQLAKDYKKIQEKSKNIKFLSERAEQINRLDAVEDDMKVFLYMLARTAAGSIFGKKRKYQYSSKTQNLKEYTYVKKRLDVLIKMMKKMTHGTYGKYLYRRLYNIGFYILKHFYYPLSISVKKVNGVVYFAYLL